MPRWVWITKQALSLHSRHLVSTLLRRFTSLTISSSLHPPNPLLTPMHDYQCTHLPWSSHCPCRSFALYTLHALLIQPRLLCKTVSTTELVPLDRDTDGEDRFEQYAPAPLASFSINRVLPLSGWSASQHRHYTRTPAWIKPNSEDILHSQKYLLDLKIVHASSNHIVG